MAVRFAFELIDKMSGPLGRVGKSLGALDRGIQKASGVMGLLDRTSKGALTAADRTSVLKTAMTGLDKGLGLAAAGARRSFGVVRSGASWMAGGTVAAAAQITAALATATVGAAAFGAKMLYDALKFRESTGQALKFTQGTAGAASETMADVGRIANLLGTSTEGALDKFRELNAKGFDAQESKILLQFAADLKAYNKGKDVSADAIAEPLKALKAGGALNVDSFKALQDANMSRTQLNERLAKQLGVNVEGMNENRSTAIINQALAKIPRGQQAVSKLMDMSIAAMGQKALGEGAQDFQLKTVSGLLDTIQNRWGNLLQMVNTEGPGSGLVRILGKVAAALDPTTENGKKLLATFDKLSEAVGEALEGFDPEDMIDGLLDIADGVDRVLGPVKSVGEGFSEGFGEARTTIRQLGEELGFTGGQSTASSEALKTLGEALGYVVVGIGLVIGGAIWLEAQLVIFAIKVFKAAADLGGKVIDGIVAGLQKGKALLTGAVEAIADLIPGHAGKKLEVRSPSRVMMRLGAHTAEGLAQGIEGGERRVEQSAEALATSAVRGGAQPTAQGGGQRPTVTLPAGLVQVTVNGAGDLEEIERRVQEGILRAFREMGFELGVSPA